MPLKTAIVLLLFLNVITITNVSICLSLSLSVCFIYIVFFQLLMEAEIYTWEKAAEIYHIFVKTYFILFLNHRNVLKLTYHIFFFHSITPLWGKRSSRQKESNQDPKTSSTDHHHILTRERERHRPAGKMNTSRVSHYRPFSLPHTTSKQHTSYTDTGNC